MCFKGDKGTNTRSGLWLLICERDYNWLIPDFMNTLSQKQSKKHSGHICIFFYFLLENTAEMKYALFGTLYNHLVTHLLKERQSRLNLEFCKCHC